MARRQSKNKPRMELQRTATKIVTRLMNWNQYRVGTRLQRVHTDCLGRKFSAQRSQYTLVLPAIRIQTAIAAIVLRLIVQKLLVRGSVLVSGVFPAQKFNHWFGSNAWFRASPFRRIRNDPRAALRGTARGCPGSAELS